LEGDFEMTFDQKISIVKEALPGFRPEIVSRISNMGRNTIHDTLRRMEGLGVCKVKFLEQQKKYYYCD
jgi:hypothetical protein